MAISTYASDKGESLWKVYVNVRSKTNPGIRAQRRIAGLKTQREAEREETKLIRECEREVFEKESQGETWGAVVEAYDRHLKNGGEAHLSATSRHDYVAALRKHTVPWWKRSASEISIFDARELFAQFKAQGISNMHQKKIKLVINLVYQFGIESKLIRRVERSPVIGIQINRNEEKKPEILTIAEIRKLLCDARKLNHPWYHIWALALLTGMRSGELYALEWKDIDWVNNSITVSKSFNCRFKCIKSTKAGYWRTVPISSELRALLEEIKAQAGGRTTVLHRFGKWTTGQQAGELRNFCIGLGLPSIRFHALRACFATQLIRNGVPPIQIQKICGWRDLKTMQRYIRLAGIEIDGATEGLKVLPELEITATAAKMFTA